MADMARITEGFFIRNLPLGDMIGTKLSVHAFAEIVKKRCEAIGLDHTMISGHSFRSGRITQEYQRGRKFKEIMSISRLKNAHQTLRNVKLISD